MTDSPGSPVAAKPAAHYHSVAAAWLEAECLTRGIRLHEPFAQAICARIAEAQRLGVLPTTRTALAIGAVGSIG